MTLLYSIFQLVYALGVTSNQQTQLFRVWVLLNFYLLRCLVCCNLETLSNTLASQQITWSHLISLFLLHLHVRSFRISRPRIGYGTFVRRPSNRLSSLFAFSSSDLFSSPVIVRPLNSLFTCQLFWCPWNFVKLQMHRAGLFPQDFPRLILLERQIFSF